MLSQRVKHLTTFTSSLLRACASIVNNGTSTSISNNGPVGGITTNNFPRHLQPLHLPRWYSTTIDASLIDRVNTFGMFLLCVNALCMIISISNYFISECAL